ncbi:putative GABA permease [Aspergillus japonicus CBS 114.51]|uniref:Putative GABA permease n=2 Tax=Aspergillus TaxID=5052 RepID=A0A2V5HEP3_ASPV1|nr:putative GABA permease [Aspergillus japonicus CBS 114.51]PYI22191.1 putative GABA permease [Aspergillus violaceofuscus CBS 115571]RAH76378.1 putative GABA permease [Aspergillus japonicus CBS 114.51]
MAEKSQDMDSMSKVTPAVSEEPSLEHGDMQLLAALGYKQELRRHYSTVQVFAIAFSIMGLLPSIASTLSYSIPAGPVGMVWVRNGLTGILGWFAASVFIFIVALAMADLASAMPTAGGLYFWTHYFSGEKWKNPLSFVVGYSNTIGLVGGVCSIDYGFATMLLAIVSIARDGEWTASRPALYGTYVACVVVHGLIAIFFARVMPKIQSVCIILNVGLVCVTALALPIGKAVRGGQINPGAYVFGHAENLTTWPEGWSFMIAWMSPIWTIGAFDSCVHMSEEATHAARAVPLGIVWSAGLCGLLGFVSLAVMAAVIDVDLTAVLDSKFGQPMAQIYYDSLGKSGALGFMVVVAVVQFFMGLSLVVAASRQSWAFSRDSGLPFSSFFRHVSKRIRFQPVRMVCAVVVIAIILGLLCLIDNAAASALFSLAVAGNDLAWMVPILARLVWGQDRFHPGEFYTGRLSKPIAITAIVYLAFAIVLSMFPTEGPNPTPANMNYTIVINGALWLGALLYYAVYARKVYKGPQTTVGESTSPSETRLPQEGEGEEQEKEKKGNPA